MLKILTLSAVITAIPITSHANSFVEDFCSNIGKLAGLVAMKRDLGESAYDNHYYLLDSGLDAAVTDLVITIVYEIAPYENPETVTRLTYIGCVKAHNE
jgi:hypothetical protein